MVQLRFKDRFLEFFAPLRVRIIALVLLTAIPALVAIVTTTAVQRQQSLRDAREEARIVAVLEARRLGSLVDSVDILTAALSEVEEVARGDAASCGRHLKPLVAVSPALANLGRADGRGKINCTAMQTTRQLYPPLVAAARPGGFSLSDGVLGPDEAESLVLARPLPGSGHVMFFVFRLDWVGSLTAANLPVGTVLTIHSVAGDIVSQLPIGVMRPKIEQPERPGLSEEWPEQRLLLLSSDITHGGPCADSPQICNREGLVLGHVTVSIPMQEIYAEANYLLARDLVVLAALSLFFITAAWVGTDRFVLRGVRKLLRSVERIRSGDLATRTGMRGRGEIVKLGQGFDRMADDLAKRDREVHEQLGRVARLNRVYRVLTGINSAVMRLNDREALFLEVCRIAVDQGGYPLAWIGVPHPDSGFLVPAASMGSGRGYLDEIAVSASEDEHLGRGPSGMAYRSGQRYICNDIEEAPEMAPWRDAAARYGLRASAAFPLRCEHGTAAVLTIYADEPGHFDADEAQLFMEVASNISYALDHIASMGRLDFMVNFDPLTNLPNRALFEDRVQQALARAALDKRAVAIAAVQINELERINDVHGFAVGDDTLKQLCTVLQGHLREGDTLARIGGQTFGIMLDDMQAEQDSFTVMKRIMNAFPISVQAGGEQLNLTARSGITVYPGDSESAADLVRHAELILHTAEHANSTSYHFYSPEVDRLTRERYQLEHDLRTTIERGELELHYQPIVQVPTRKTVGLEALARWRHRERGDISPSEFIPAAEQAGLINALGEWAMRTACRQGFAWRDEKIFKGRISVNVSALQLYEPGFADSLRAMVAAMKHKPHITFEVTETKLMHDVEHAVEVLSDLQELDFEISVDDFGTGYSSLSYLNRLPLNQVKIDRSFITGLCTDATAAAVARSIIALSHSLKLTVVAEGVETEEQFQFLAALGCDRAQGYLFSRPLPAAEIEAYLRG